MTAPDVSLARRFGRLLRDPAFRRRLRDCGWSNGMVAYLASPGETDAAVKARMEPGRHLLVAPDADVPFGLRMHVFEVDR